MTDIYLDHAATTPVRPEVWKAMKPYLDGTVTGNPSSIHRFGREARKVVDATRMSVAESVGASTEEIVFTSGGTEADNLAITGVARARKHEGTHVITTEAEHHAVLHACRQLEREGYDVTYLPVMPDGTVRMDALEEALREDTILVTIMYGNNETGAINPINDIGGRLHAHKALFHTDAVQAYGVLSLDVASLHVDLLTASAHKINGPKGMGFLYVKKETRLHPLLFGGEQEQRLRPGTENVPAIAGFGAAVELLTTEKQERATTYGKLISHFLAALENENVAYEINGDERQRLPHIINLYFPGTSTEALLTQLDLEGIAVSSGSACTAGSFQPSHVLKAMFGENDARVRSSVRISVGYDNNEAQLNEAAKVIANISEQHRRVLVKK
ncbi:cysteine desulfurase family protein [Salicibibacter kimchii]|uniref:cysteine desulfurase n=1 Tax=Salicibibacter kimchii TaxID=2099786 RepID=A0A345C3I6_9BACI|nr:cysteine desulfurase family protein [Salicibibacter kimchii]AXF57767.1 cysteine desulfurase [Salicibibacter kimchii]